MRTINFLLLLIMLITTGCDQETARLNQSRKQFEQVLVSLENVEIGYVVASDEQIQAKLAGKDVVSHRESMEEFRQNRLARVLKELDPIMATGTQEQKVTAQRLASDIYTSSARYQLRQLLDHWTSLSNRSVVMISYMVAVGKNYTLANNMQFDDSKLISQLKKELRDTNVSLEKLEKESEQFEGKLKVRTKKIANYKKQIDALNRQSQQLKGKAFIASGNEKYKLLNDASIQKRQAAVQDAKRQVEQAYVGDLKAKQSMLIEQIDFTLEFMESLENQVEGITKRQAKNVSRKKLSKQKLEDRENQFMDEFNLVVGEFSKTIHPQFAKINADLEQAISVLKTAHQNADSETKNLIEIELLAKQVTATNMRTSMMMVTHDLGQKYALILNRATKGKHRLMADRKTTFQSAYEHLQQIQNDNLKLAQTTLETSRQQATVAMNLVSEEGEMTRVANAANAKDMGRLSEVTEELSNLLTNYAKRIDGYKLN